LNNLLNPASKNPLFVVIGTLASIIGLIVGIADKSFVIWGTFSICIIIFIIISLLVGQNARMLGRLDVIHCDVFNQNVNLELDENKDIYLSQPPIIIALTSFLTPETANKKPTVSVQIDYPPQLSLDLVSDISKDESNSNIVKFTVPLKSATQVLTIRTVSLAKDKENDFILTNRKITITFESELLEGTKKEVLMVSV
jgi:hypothetical protein